MSLHSRHELVHKLYTVVGFNDKGEEIARAVGLTEAEMEVESKKYHTSSIMESEIVTPKVYCEVEDCTRLAIAVIKLSPDGEPIKVCKYHAAGVHLRFKPPVEIEDKMMWKGFILARDFLCVKYCPSYWQDKVDGKVRGRCRAFQEPRSAKERRKREKGYTVYGQNLTVLCIEDSWWRL